MTGGNFASGVWAVVTIFVKPLTNAGEKYVFTVTVLSPSSKVPPTVRFRALKRDEEACRKTVVAIRVRAERYVNQLTSKQILGEC